MPHYKFIYDEIELKFFFENVVPDLLPVETLFISVSARSKQLTEEEKRETMLGRTEMFERKIIRYKNWDKFLSTIRKYEVPVGTYLSKNNKSILQKCLMLYMNINPSNSIKALREFNKIMNEYYYEMANIALNNRNMDDLLYRINKSEVLLHNCYQKNTGSKHWMDFDFDIPKYINMPELMKEFLDDILPKYFWVDTKGGYHLLVHLKSFQKGNLGFNPKKIVDKGYEVLKRYQNDLEDPIENYEIMHNKNQMCVIPGTLQANYPVKIIKNFSKY